MMGERRANDLVLASRPSLRLRFPAGEGGYVVEGRLNKERAPGPAKLSSSNQSKHGKAPECS